MTRHKPALEALERLREGNRRFVSGTSSGDGLSRLTQRAELVAGQQPFAIILGCSDSRVPAEIVFDQGLGVREAVRANVRAAANQLRHGSELIERLCEQDGLLIVGAEYSLESGVVHILDGVQASDGSGIQVTKSRH